MIDVAIIMGSTRPGRNGEAVAGWVHDLAVKRGDARFEVVDLADFPLPPLDEPMPAITGRYTRSHTRTWAAKIASFDAYVFVTPEYNHSAPGPLKNAIDFLYAEWTNKAVGFVGYGSVGGVRAIEHLRLVMSCLQVAHVSAQVELSLFTDFEDFTVFRPAGRHEDTLTTLLDQVLAWSAALKPLRTGERCEA
ncbi:NADPH-dependent FMN reductase [Nonomuraea jabiensis]|uniref:NAD(P)H-dependent FMN reductase n=1 Tax=Nonomuraea jabiensis TaxID=882448 RepID=A0A7W9L936_9ACTN|nr:NAD(P)H-dependent oxidoreductase [Nonomuraea jabiensis]MBB5775180.1 NAD(P)H-dependent FMN reductase [Nonomuraea jabiensis]